MIRRFGVPLTAIAMVCCALPVHSQDSLPPGGAHDVVASVCSQCHGLAQITRSGYDRAGWQNVVAMMRNAGAQLSAAQVPAVVDYLAQNFPPKPAPSAQVISGSVHVSIEEWQLPTAGSRPHDPLAAPDGTIWYTGQMANVLGHLDPKTGRITEYHLTTPESGPHGLVMDRGGNIWFTANFKGYIGKLDPASGRFTEYKLPDPAAQDPHTPLFDRNGTLWFTVQGGDMVGRLQPQTGEIKLVRVPTPHANPYGLVITSRGVPYFAEFGTNKIASIDPQTMAIHEHPLPNPDTRPRRIAITPDDVIYYTDYPRGYLGRFDTKTGAVTEWRSPGGPRSEPYGIAFLKGAVWYSESGVQPNTIVRFDPATQAFASWTIPSGGGVVRNMMPTRDGNIAIACSGVNRVGLVEVR